MRSRPFTLMVAILFASQTFLLAAPPVIPVIPTQPEDFDRRGLGSGGIGSVHIAPPSPRASEKTYRRVNYIAVSPEREWSNAAGKKISGSLLAFEEGLSETVRRPFTLIKEGNVRLLRTGMKVPQVFPMTLLSKEDQDFIRALDAANRKAAIPTGPAA